MFVLCSIPAYGDIVFVGTIDQVGAGIGGQFTIINAGLAGNAVGTVEDADLTFDLSGNDLVVNTSDTTVTGGANNQSWNLATDLGISDASELALVFNIDETGQDAHVTLNRLTLWVWDGDSVEDFDLGGAFAGQSYGGDTGLGIGSQGFVFKLDAAQQAELNAIIAAAGGADQIRIGGGFAADNVNAGFETLNVARVSPSSVPEPMTLLLLGSGLLGVGMFNRRRQA